MEFDAKAKSCRSICDGMIDHVYYLTFTGGYKGKPVLPVGFIPCRFEWLVLSMKKSFFAVVLFACSIGGCFSSFFGGNRTN
jgi:hypothetical protein